MTEDDRRTAATRLILALTGHLTISEVEEDHVREVERFTDEDVAAVAELIATATVTVSWDGE